MTWPHEAAAVVAIRVAHTGQVLAGAATIARTPMSRIRGLLGRDTLPDGEALVLTSCRSIHTAFMQFPIDVVFVTRQWTVVRVVRALPPWRLSPWVWGAQMAVELPAGTVDRIPLRPGDRLVVQAAG